MISFSTIDVAFPDIDPERLRRWIEKVAQSYGRTVGEITYIFVDDSQILKLNRQYLQHDYFTDIITFDYSERDIIAGDIFISTDTVASNAATLHTGYEEELHRVIIHGVLHLCGINDKGEGEREKMVEAENNALTMLQCI